MAVLSIPNVLVTGTTIQAAPFNQNFQAIQTSVNSVDNSQIGPAGIFASQLLPTTLGQATFGGAIGYLHLAPSASTTPLTVSGVAGQSADIFDVTLTSGGTNALRVTAAGALQVGNGAATAAGDGGFARNATSGLIVLGSTITTAGAFDFGVSTVGNIFTMKNGSGVLSTLNAGTLALNGAFTTTAGDAGVARGAATGGVWFGTSNSTSGFLDFGVTNAGGFSFKAGAGTTFAPLFGGAYTNSSDATLKTNVLPIADAITIIMSLKPVSFDWKHDGSSSLGFLAQDVQGVLPQLVSTDNNGSMGVNYDGMIPVCVATNQEIISKLRAAGVAGF